MSYSIGYNSDIISASVERSKTAISHALYWLTQKQKSISLSKIFHINQKEFETDVSARPLIGQIPYEAARLRATSYKHRFENI